MADSGPAGGAALAAPAPGAGGGGPGPRVYFQSPPGAAGEGPGSADDEGPVRRQGKVTVKYDRKELRKRLNLEEWILEQLTRLYDCQVWPVPPARTLPPAPRPCCPGTPPRARLSPRVTGHLAPARARALPAGPSPRPDGSSFLSDFRHSGSSAAAALVKFGVAWAPGRRPRGEVCWVPASPAGRDRSPGGEGARPRPGMPVGQPGAPSPRAGRPAGSLGPPPRDSRLAQR